MRLDLPSLFLMTVAVTFTVGVLFLLSWSQTRRERALAVWGIAHIGGSAASLLLALRGQVPDSLSIGLANAMMIASYGLIWSGVRAFEGRPLRLGWAVGGGALWIAACLIPSFLESLPARVSLASTLAGLYCASGALMIWQGRGEPLVSRYPALVLMATYAGLYWIRVPLAFTIPAPTSLSMASPWFAILCFVGTLFSVAIAFVFMALTKERAEREQRLAAETDSLTGIANRRALVAGAERQLAVAPAALLLFDLDHFKTINDRYGHSVGDAALAAFCHVAAPLLPPKALFGRMGGEEFACLLPRLDERAAMRIAEAIRAAVAQFTHPDYPELAMRVSAGVAAESQIGGSLDYLLRRADDALYRAKHAGRDRVVAAGEDRRPLGETVDPGIGLRGNAGRRSRTRLP
ncbi:dethiobiotin synthetase [Methylobacterium sp. Leaf123]|uniref:GGDEF domain-containing protein n=1 Tax=Methylobacterium sp. Leaf123 TaxID=1736264 RepID=UPI0006F2A038|nr:GGDEF domain-containing protein [Methylobacterium sp. Leaf123]KQQ31391.1 dethiobiotin synthetase [Methylobacterium sp. Leaf123]